MKRTYHVRYRAPGQWFWRKIKNVTGDEVLGNPGVTQYWCRVFTCENDSIRYLPLSYEIEFPPERQALITHQMSAEIGQPVQRA